MRILYNSKLSEHKIPFGVLRENEQCTVSLNIPQSCKTRSVKLELFDENGGFYAAVLINKDEQRNIPDGYEKFKGSFSLSEAGLYFYRFYITTEDGEFPLYRQGYSDTNMCEGDFWQLSCVPKDFHTPKGFAGKVMYQIFPDRFFKWGECSLEGKTEPFWVHKSTDEIPEFRPDQNGEVLNCDFFGGNLKGISKKLGYLSWLGVRAIYLNPIFKAYSNHRYDTSDYKKIDEMLGSEQDFVKLCKKAHRYGIKIILDGVFSHTGSRSVYFESATQNPNSPYRGWYDFKSYPDDYTSWWGIKTLPCVNELNSSFREFIIGGEDSVIAHWLKAGADGFRLDVADELPDEFIKELRLRMKEIKPGSFLIGEVWEDASNKISYSKRRRYFTDGELDSVMNYPFRSAIIDFVLGKDDGTGFEKTVMSIAENYPDEVVLCLMNSLSTHDTPRILSVLSGAEAPDSKEQRAEFCLNEQQRSLAIARLKCAAFLQFVLPGMPCIYYGDEIGTEGFEDPFCRSFFNWEKGKKSPLKRFYKKLAAMRNKSNPLKYGDISVEQKGGGILKIVRKHGGKCVIAIVNCSSQPSVIKSEGSFKMGENIQTEKGGLLILPLGFALFEK